MSPTPPTVVRYDSCQFTFSVETPCLSCFACHKRVTALAIRTDQEAPERLDNLVLLRSSSYGPPLYRLLDPIEEEFLKSADAAGWRVITLYGQTLHVCPDCRRKHARTRPEWERRLFQPQAPPAADDPGAEGRHG